MPIFIFSLRSGTSYCCQQTEGEAAEGKHILIVNVPLCNEDGHSTLEAAHCAEVLVELIQAGYGRVLPEEEWKP